jgi:NTE family protein
MISQISFAQDSITKNKKPKIGLVLSGGGAKGLAHIGVLKVIDSLGIKIDYIGGTSMGAIIGGLYASGYSATELDSIFKLVDADALLQDFTPRDSKTFYEKRNDEIYAVTLPFKNFKLSLPSALSKGFYNFNLLSRLTMHVSDIKDFKKLPIPFFCIATDVESGEEIILESGVLAKAMVASSALPTLYNPIEIEEKLLVDGGVVNNYPVEVLRKKGADIVIGVDVQEGLKTKENLNGVANVLSQISNLATLEKMKEKIELTDIYIKPDIRAYSIISFEKGQEIILEGVKATNKEITSLKKLTSNYKKPFLNLFKKDSIQIGNIHTGNLRNYTRSYVLGKLRFKPNSTIRYKNFKKGMNNLNASQNFDAIFYSFENNQEKKDLIIEVKEKEVNTFLKFGAHYDGLFKSGALINFTQKKLLTKNDVFSFDLVLGDNFRYNLNYYIDNGFHWSIGLNSKLYTFNKNAPKLLLEVGEGINTINVDYSDMSHQFYIQTVFAQKGSIGAGAELKHLKIKSETLAASNSVFDKSDYMSLFGFAKFDSFDKKYFPKKGGYFNGEIKSFVYSKNYNDNYDNFSIVKADMAIVQTFFNKITLKAQSEGGFAIGERSVGVFDFAIGGHGFTNVNNIRPFLGYDFLDLIGDSYIKGSVVVDYTLIKKHHVNFTANFANIGTNIFENDTWISKPKYSGYGFGYGYETVIGPIEIKHSWSPETRKHFTWFTVGFYF